MAVWADIEVEEDEPFEERPTLAGRAADFNVASQAVDGDEKRECDSVEYISQALRCYPYAFR